MAEPNTEMQSLLDQQASLTKEIAATQAEIEAVQELIGGPKPTDKESVVKPQS